jgi:crossover junction endodeoxyribonuclease RuvC
MIQKFLLKSLKVHIFEAMIAEKIILGIDPGTTVMGLELFP